MLVVFAQSSQNAEKQKKQQKQQEKRGIVLDKIKGGIRNQAADILVSDVGAVAAPEKAQTVIEQSQKLPVVGGGAKASGVRHIQRDNMNALLGIKKSGSTQCVDHGAAGIPSFDSSKAILNRVTEHNFTFRKSGKGVVILHQIVAVDGNP